MSYLSCVCDFGILWPNRCIDQDETWHAGRPRPWPHCVRWGHNSPPKKGGGSAQSSADVRRGQTAGCIKMPLGMEGGLGLGNFALHGKPAHPPPRKGRGHSPRPQFSAHVYYDQTTGLIKMPLGTGDIVLDGDPDPLFFKGAQPPIFGP